MKILWVSTGCIGPVSRILDMPQSGSSGGWIQSEYESYLPYKTKDTEMFFLCASRSVENGGFLKRKTEEGTAYCVNLPRISFGIELSSKNMNVIQDIISEVNPDLIHIWGTESSIVYSVSKLTPKIKKVVFLQGLIGIQTRYSDKYISEINTNSNDFGKIPLKDKIVQRIRDYFWKKQIDFEQYIIKNANNVIIDNEFSETYCRSISSEINCYYRFLSPSELFYNKKWEIDSCEKYSIFTVFSQTPLKGLHQLIRAVAILKKSFPQVKLMIPGPFNCENGKLKKEKFLSSYEVCIYKFIKKYSLEDNVVFLGKLSANEMSDFLSQCHVFVNPSCMEVHALSLREAMSVGIPSVSSLCGSVIEYVKHGENGLIYRYEEFEMLANSILKLFSDEKLSTKISLNSIGTINNYRIKKQVLLSEIYNSILKQI